MMRLCNHAGQSWSSQQENWRKVSQNLRELLATDIFCIITHNLTPVRTHCKTWGARVEPRPRELHPFPGNVNVVASCMRKMKNIVFVFLAYFILGTGHLPSATG